MAYTPHAPKDTAEMLSTLGLSSVNDLFACIPEKIRLQRPLDIPAIRSEAEILREFEGFAEKNRAGSPSFLGAGCYRRFIPAAVDYLSGRGEFNTAYTPYQPEVSQGTLQAIFEYQSMICRLTGMDISNASMYEGATALAEAVLMSYAVSSKGTEVIVSEGVHPHYREVLETYLAQHPVELRTLPLRNGQTSADEVAEALTDQTLAVVLQNPNFFGVIEDGLAISTVLDGLKERPFFIAVTDPISLAVLKPPGEYGADIAVGEGQQLGNYPSYGGPSFGFFATRMAHVRKLPGRVVGETTDREGKCGYVLTFQTREQHIRRENATSNICTNQGLCCLRGAIYMALMGETGLRAVAETSTRKAHYAHSQLTRITGVSPVYNEPFFHEFAVELPLPAETVYASLQEANVGAGLPLGRVLPDRDHQMLFAFTELNTTGEIDALAAHLGQLVATADTREKVASGERP